MLTFYLPAEPDPLIEKGVRGLWGQGRCWEAGPPAGRFSDRPWMDLAGNWKGSSFEHWLLISIPEPLPKRQGIEPTEGREDSMSHSGLFR